jgi:hypothetical protein
MRKDHILMVLTGPRIRSHLRRHNSVIEGWNDHWIKYNGMKSTDRDRLGYKETRVQALLAQALDESGYDVIVESYFDWLVRQSCDIFATKPYGPSRRYWIEIKSKNVDRGGDYGGINLIRQVLGDIGKMKAGKSNGDRVVIWVGFWGSAKSVKACIEAEPTQYTFRIRLCSPGRLRKLYAHGVTSRSKLRLQKLLGHCGSGSVPQALHDLRRWIIANGGKCEIMKVRRGKDERRQGWASYGILCGMMS